MPAPSAAPLVASLPALVISCEHGGNRIPETYAGLFQDYQALLQTHRGYDPGALEMAHDLASAFAAPLVTATVSRLLVDLNRSRGHPRLHGQALRGASGALRREIIETYYQPYRLQAAALVQAAIQTRGRVIHLSCHSFTPELNGQLRRADLGLLYDPARPAEADLCHRWKTELEALAPRLRVRRNYPYAGKGDGLTAWFRHHLPADAYVGIELEINQKHVFQGDPAWSYLRGQVVRSLHSTLSLPDPDPDPNPRSAP